MVETFQRFPWPPLFSVHLKAGHQEVRDTSSESLSCHSPPLPPQGPDPLCPSLPYKASSHATPLLVCMGPPTPKGLDRWPEAPGSVGDPGSPLGLQL